MTCTSADAFITEAIERGERDGADSLDETARAVFLLSELEVSCDKDGIDTFLNGYGAAEFQLVADLLAEAVVNASCKAQRIYKCAAFLIHLAVTVLTILSMDATVAIQPVGGLRNLL